MLLGTFWQVLKKMDVVISSSSPQLLSAQILQISGQNGLHPNYLSSSINLNLIQKIHLKITIIFYYLF